jgi:hypothetical protein
MVNISPNPMGIKALIDRRKKLMEKKMASRVKKSELKWRRREVAGKASKGYRPRVV